MLIVLKRIRCVLIVILIVAILWLVIIKRYSYSVTKTIIGLNDKIIFLRNKKQLLMVELTYLTSPERLIFLIEKNPKLLDRKTIVSSRQIQTRDEFVKTVKIKSTNKSQFAKGVETNIVN
jgi:hypothetical protein